MNTAMNLIEPLEARIAPAGVTILDGGRTAQWIDVDGDRVTLKASKPIFTPEGSQFTFLPQDLPAGDIGEQLALLDLHDLGAAGKGVNLTFSARRDVAAHQGDGAVNVGRIDATGVDLGKIVLPGDLASLDVGDGDVATPALAAITTLSAGALGTTTQGAQLNGLPTFLTWSALGSVGPVTVKGDFHVAFEAHDASGGIDKNLSIKIGAVTIWGDLVGGDGSLTGYTDEVTAEPIGSGYIFSEGTLGPVIIRGDLVGGSDLFAGSVSTFDGKIASVTVGGDLLGGTARHTGEISGSAMGKILISGSILGGSAVTTGQILSYSTITSVTVRGNLVGGDISDTGLIFAQGALGPVTIGGDVLGGATPRDAEGLPLKDPANNPAITVRSGAIGSGTRLDAVKIRGNVDGGDGVYSGAVFTESGSHGNIKSVTIDGTLSGGRNVRFDTNALVFAYGIYADGQLGAVKVGALRGDDPFSPVAIVALGTVAPQTASAALAIASVTVARGAFAAEILAGYNPQYVPENPDVQIGPVKIGNNFVASSISAGTSALDEGFGDPNNQVVGTLPDDSAIRSRIRSLTVGVYILGNPFQDANFFTGAVAQEIGAVKVGGTALELTATTATNRDRLALGVSHDFFVSEVPWT